MARSFNNLYWIEVGKLRERERIISMIKDIEHKYPHKDYSPTEVIDLVNGVEFNKNNQITNTYRGWE
jgi:hypothetical protein